MGKIILRIPRRIILEYQISDNAEVEKLIKKFEKIKKENSQNGSKVTSNEKVVGIWKDRFPSNKSSVAIAKQLRKKAWTRY